MNNWLNYHHLYYFWIIVCEQSVSGAAQKLRLAQPTLSVQLKQLEDNLDTKLFDRRGKKLNLTDDGKFVFKYADNIFTLGAEMLATLKGNMTRFDLKLRVGVTDSVPKLITHKTLIPLNELEEAIKVECYEGSREELFSQLGLHELDLVLTDAPFSSEVAVKAFNHYLGSSEISLYGTKEIVGKIKGHGIKRFNEVPFILPTRNTMLRRAVDTWFESNSIIPNVVAEFEDSALLKTFGAEGGGLFPMAAVVEKEVQKHYNVVRALKLKDIKEDFYAISLERKVTHPAIAIITAEAKKNLR